MELNNDFLQELSTIRRRLHQVPEIAFDLFKTHDIVKEYLISYGYDIEIVASTGIVAVKKGKNNESVAFRADMDALMVTEKTEVCYESTHKGKMHACGHDGHMAILLGFAKYISKLDNLSKSIVLIFQPAEEGPGGAKKIIDEGVLLRYNVQSIFGLHIFPGIEEGKIGLANGPLMAQNGEVDIIIQGRSAHGAMPHKGSDAILAASTLVLEYQSILSRRIDPLEPAVLTLGTISGGEARNIIAGEVSLTGTIRAFNPEVYKIIKNKMADINQGIAKLHEVNVKMEVRDFYPPVVNDSTLYELVKSSLTNEDIVSVKPLMLAEDFAFYQQEVPGFFMLLGSKNEEKGFTQPLHNACFNFDEKILLTGITSYISICRQLGIF